MMQRGKRILITQGWRKRELEAEDDEKRKNKGDNSGMEEEMEAEDEDGAERKNNVITQGCRRRRKVRMMMRRMQRRRTKLITQGRQRREVGAEDDDDDGERKNKEDNQNFKQQNRARLRALGLCHLQRFSTSSVSFQQGICPESLNLQQSCSVSSLPGRPCLHFNFHFPPDPYIKTQLEFSHFLCFPHLRGCLLPPRAIFTELQLSRSLRNSA